MRKIDVVMNEREKSVGWQGGHQIVSVIVVIGAVVVSVALLGRVM